MLVNSLFSIAGRGPYMAPDKIASGNGGGGSEKKKFSEATLDDIKTALSNAGVKRKLPIHARSVHGWLVRTMDRKGINRENLSDFFRRRINGDSTIFDAFIDQFSVESAPKPVAKAAPTSQTPTPAKKKKAVDLTLPIRQSSSELRGKIIYSFENEDDLSVVTPENEELVDFTLEKALDHIPGFKNIVADRSRQIKIDFVYNPKQIATFTLNAAAEHKRHGAGNSGKLLKNQLVTANRSGEIAGFTSAFIGNRTALSKSRSDDSKYNNYFSTKLFKSKGELVYFMLYHNALCVEVEKRLDNVLNRGLHPTIIAPMRVAAAEVAISSLDTIAAELDQNDGGLEQELYSEINEESWTRQQAERFLTRYRRDLRETN